VDVVVSPLGVEEHEASVSIATGSRARAVDFSVIDFIGCD